MTGRRSITVGAAAPDITAIRTPFLAIDTEAVATALADPEWVAEYGDARVDVGTIEAVCEAIAAVARAERPWRDPAVLATLYYERGLTQADIAAELGTSQQTIARWMGTYDLGPELADVALVENLLNPDSQRGRGSP